MYKIKDVYKFKSIMDSKEYLFGTVVKHYKYEEDHHIITSEVVEFDSEKLIAKTKSGSIYEIENIFKTRKEFEDFHRAIKKPFFQRTFVKRKVLINIIFNW